MPLHTIMMAAKTVSRANPAFSAGAAIITETINAVSMAVTARARTRGPNGSPTRCAITSAWYTAAYTVPNNTMLATAATRRPPPRKEENSRTTHAKAGHAHVHQVLVAVTMSVPNVRWLRR